MRFGNYKRPVLGIEDGRTRGTTSVAPVCGDRFPARSKFAWPSRLSALSGGPGRSYAGTGRSGAGSGVMSTRVRTTRLPSTRVCCSRTGSGLVPFIACDVNSTDVVPREPTNRFGMRGLLAPAIQPAGLHPTIYGCQPKEVRRSHEVRRDHVSEPVVPQINTTWADQRD